MKDLKDVLGKKDRKPSEDEKNAKLAALKDLRSEMRGMMGGDLVGKMNKVTVAAPDKEALAVGLDKAKEVVEQSPEMDEAEESMETSEEESSEQDEIADLKKQIEELKALLKK